MAILENGIAVVTGASSGIGKAIALRFAREGAAVVVVHHDHPDEAEEVVKAIAAAGGRAIVVAADVRDEGDVDMVFEQAHKAFGAPTILVNAAGVDAAGILVADMEVDHFEMVLKTNLVGPFLFCRAFVRGCKPQRRAARSSTSPRFTRISRALARPIIARRKAG